MNELESLDQRIANLEVLLRDAKTKYQLLVDDLASLSEENARLREALTLISNYDFHADPDWYRTRVRATADNALNPLKP